MGIREMWHEARGDVLRKEYEDVAMRMQGMNEYALWACFNKIQYLADEFVSLHDQIAHSKRKRMLKDARKAISRMWDSEEWPEALGATIVCMNAESRHLPGDDAAYVKAQTDRIIEQAKAAFHGQFHGQDVPHGTENRGNGGGRGWD